MSNNNVIKEKATEIMKTIDNVNSPKKDKRKIIGTNNINNKNQDIFFKKNLTTPEKVEKTFDFLVDNMSSINKQKLNEFNLLFQEFCDKWYFYLF